MLQTRCCRNALNEIYPMLYISQQSHNISHFYCQRLLHHRSWVRISCMTGCSGLAEPPIFYRYLSTFTLSSKQPPKGLRTARGELLCSQGGLPVPPAGAAAGNPRAAAGMQGYLSSITPHSTPPQKGLQTARGERLCLQDGGPLPRPQVLPRKITRCGWHARVSQQHHTAQHATTKRLADSPR